MNTEITSFEITGAERRRLSYNKCRYNYTFVMAACISFAMGFLLKLIGLIAKPQNNNLRLFFESAILPSTVIGAVFFIIATVRLILCWIPKSNEKVILQFDPLTRTIEITTGRKTKRLEVRSVVVIASDNLIIFHGLIRQAMFPLSCFDPNKLILFLPKTVK